MGHFLIFLVLSSVMDSEYQQEIPLPEGYYILDTAQGDLDNDGVQELAVAYNTEEVKEKSFKNVLRDLIVYKNREGTWEPWKSSQQAIYGSRRGGSKGDPFDTMKIENGLLHITQHGGRSWTWTFTDTYRFQDNDLHLIGYTSTSGAPCEYWQNVDLDVPTGIMLVEKEWEDCESGSEKAVKAVNERVSVKDLKITLENRHSKRIHIITPKEELEVFVSTGQH